MFSQTECTTFPRPQSAQMVWKPFSPTCALGFLAARDDDDDDHHHDHDGTSRENVASARRPLQSKSAVSKRPYCRSISTDSEESDDDEFELRPLIKEELRHSIQKKRWQLGLLDWGLEDYDKKRSHKNNQLTQEELMKREDRKNRNRVAAAKCRKKRRNRLDELQRTMDSLETRRDELMVQKEKLSQEKAQLRQMVEEHFKVCRPSVKRPT